MNTARRALATVTAAALTLFPLSACSPKGSLNEEELQAMGNATPAASPKASTPAGTVLDVAGITSFASAPSATTFAVRTPVGLVIGTPDDFVAGTTHTVSMDSSCGVPSAVQDAWIIACPTGRDGTTRNAPEIMTVTSIGNVTTLPVGEPFTVATRVNKDTFVAGRQGTKKVWLLNADGSDSHTVDILKQGIDRIVTVPNPHGLDQVEVVNHELTAVYSVLWKDKKSGAGLRIGLGVGEISAADDGIFLAADTIGKQAMVYTTDPVLRLHMAIQTQGSPWAVAWDNKNRVVWVATTDNNLLTAYDIATGTGIQRGSFPSIANVRGLGVVDGKLVAASATDGVQIIDAQLVAQQAQTITTKE